MSTDGLSCASCRYRDQDPDADRPICRRNPPQILPSDVAFGYQSKFPQVSWRDWCGEHEPKPSEPRQR